MWQELATALIVAVAVAYACWTLMPLAWRRSLAKQLGRPSPDAACGGCHGCAAPVEPQKKTVTVFRRLR